MPRVHMTDIVVSRLKQLGTYYDQTTPAFGLRVGKNRKTWFVIRGRHRLRTNIGLYPAVSLADARKQARVLLTVQPIKGDRMTFNLAYDLYKETLKAKKPRTQHDYIRALDGYLKPALGFKKLSDIEYEDITAITEPLARSVKRNTLAVGRTFFRWCVRPPRRYIKHSPLEGVELPKIVRRARILNDDELKIVWSAAERQGYPFGIVCQLLTLTGQRRGEIANLRRPWINEKHQTITLPVWLTKNSKEHTFPYGDLVASILQDIPRRNDTDLLFPSDISAERPLSGWSKYKKQLADGVAGWTLHDLRRTYRSIHGQIGTSSEIAERLINHAAAVQTDVEAIYDRWHYLPQMRQAVSAFETHFKALLAVPM
jgi:integrase